MTALGIGMTIDPHIVGRIEESDIDALTCAHHLLQEREIAAIASANPVGAQLPDITHPGAWCLRHCRDHLVFRVG